MTGDDSFETGSAGTEGSERIVVPEWLAVGTGLLLVSVIRLFPFPSVIRNGDIVLSANDPYAYRYYVETVTETASSPLDLTAFLALPGNVENGEPLLVAVTAFIAELFGGSAHAVGMVLAWYPVVTALVSGLVIYALGKHISGDPRVGLAALGLFAVVPGHVFRTGLGFADHHAFDYLWLILTAYALVIAMDTGSEGRKRWSAALLGVAVAAQTLAWEASPLLLVPLAGCVAVSGFFLARERRPEALQPVVIGLVLATGIVVPVHVAFGWQSTTVAAAPALLFLGSIGVYAVTWSVVEFDRSPYVVPVTILVGGIGITAIGLTVPTVTAEANKGLGRLFRSSGIAETTALGDAFGSLVGPMIMLGYTLFLGLPVLVWVFWRSRHETHLGWLLVCIYALHFLLLSSIQRRFTGELAPFLSILAGFGLLALANWVDLVSPVALDRSRNPESPPSKAVSSDTVPLPERRRFLANGSLSVIFLGFPAIYAGELQSRLAVTDRMYRTANSMRQLADRRDLSWPESYVFSQWGNNRFYNYFVNGQSRSYAYARRHYLSFLRSSHPEEWYQALRERVGFVVVDYLRSDLLPGSMYERLFVNNGSRSGRVSGLAHYRLVYVAPAGHPKVFTLVPGARIVGTASADERIELSTTVSASDTTFRYERRVTAEENGEYAVVVPYPGTYRIQDETIVVSEQAIREGREVSVDEV